MNSIPPTNREPIPFADASARLRRIGRVWVERNRHDLPLPAYVRNDHLGEWMPVTIVAFKPDYPTYLTISGGTIRSAPVYIRDLRVEAAA